MKFYDHTFEEAIEGDPELKNEETIVKGVRCCSMHAFSCCVEVLLIVRVSFIRVVS